MFQMIIRLPHQGGDRLRDTTRLGLKHDATVRAFLDGHELYPVAAIGWHKLRDYTRAVCTVTAYPDLEVTA